jgi:Protein of unknown function (DUF2939)
MRAWSGIAVLLALLTLAYAAAPFFALARLSAALKARNAAAIADRIDVPRLASSVGSQITAAYLKLEKVSDRYRGFGSYAGSVLGPQAQELISEALNSETLLDSATCKANASDAQILPCEPALSRLSSTSVLQLFWNSEYGAGDFHLTIPLNAAPTDQYRLKLQLLQWTWKLTGVELPERVRMHFARELQTRIDRINGPK